MSTASRVRQAARIAIRERVLLAADPDHGLLVVYPALVLDEILARRFSEGLGRWFPVV